MSMVATAITIHFRAIIIVIATATTGWVEPTTAMKKKKFTTTIAIKCY